MPPPISSFPAPGARPTGSADYRGGSGVVLAFYPGDFTQVCTAQLCSYRDNSEQLDRLGVPVLGISPQSLDSHERFAEENRLNIPLLADEGMKVANDYGVRGWASPLAWLRERKAVTPGGFFTERAIFVIDGEGIVRYRHVELHRRQLPVGRRHRAGGRGALLMAAPEPLAFEPAGTPALRGESIGEGPPIVLLHGITATRRYVVHGSKLLPRRGYEVITYDARGHGESGAAPDGEGYGYPWLVADLERVIEERVGEGRFLLGGHSMGAHTAVAYALEHPERLAGLVVIGPVYTGVVTDEALDYWDGLADALERDGVEGFVAFIDAQGPDPRLAGDDPPHHPGADRPAPRPAGARRGAARGASLAPVRLARRARVPRRTGAGRGQPRRRRPRASRTRSRRPMPSGSPGPA